MKKTLALVLVLMLCVSGIVCALGEPDIITPSKQQEDMTKTFVLNLGTDGFYLRLDDKLELLVHSNLEIEKLSVAPDILKYFGIPSDCGGEPDPDRLGIKDILGEGPYVVNELWPIIAGGYKDEFGDIGAVMLFPTPFKIDVPVATMIGFVHVTRDEMVGTQRILEQEVEWYAYAGIGEDTSNLDALRDKYFTTGVLQHIAIWDFRQQVLEQNEERKLENERNAKWNLQIGGILTVLDGKCIKRIESEIALCAIVQRAEDVIPVEE